MTRTRAWTKFGILVAVTIILAVAFASAIDLPSTQAQQRAPVTLPSIAPPAIPAAQPASDLGAAFVAVAEAVKPGVVFIQSETEARPSRRSPFDDFFRDNPDGPQIRRGQGSGFIISSNGYIITNNHVVEGATRLTVELVDQRSFSADVVGRDPTTDVAVIKIDAEDLPAVPLGTSENVHIGEWVLAIGNPLGRDFNFTVTAGIVSGRGRRLTGLVQTGQNYTIHDFIQTDAAINPGNSGGPLVNIRGEVIGVNSAIASQTGFYSGYGFAVPIDLAKAVSEQLIAKGHVTRAVLGISITDATPEDAEYVGLDSIFGVTVSSFPSDDSPAKLAGLKQGDVIVAVDGEPARYVAQLQREIGFRTPGQEVEVTIARRENNRPVRRSFQVRLDEAPVEDLTQVARAKTSDPPSDARYEPKIGISVREVTPAQLAQEGFDRRYAGLLITQVAPGGPADRHLIPRELITHVNGQRVQDREDLEAALAKVPVGEVFSVNTVTLAEGGQALERVTRLRAGDHR